MPAKFKYYDGESWIETGPGLHHILVASDSIGFGAGSTSPKWQNSWVGVLRDNLNSTYGSCGTGLVLANNDLTPSNLSWDGRFSLGASETDQTSGWYRSAAWLLPSGSANYVEFSASGSEAVLYCFTTTAGLGRVSVDGGTAKSFRVMASGGTTPELEKESGYHSGHVVVRVPLGSDGAHTIRIWGDGTSIVFWGIEVRTSNSSGYIVSNASVSGKAMGGLITSDNTGGTYGLPLLDTAMKAVVDGTVILALETNEWTGTATTATVKSNLLTAINRVISGGYRPVVMVAPQPNPSLQGGSMTYSQMVTAVSEQCSSSGVDFLNLQKLWTTGGQTNETTMFSDGNNLGYYADGIHPSNSGAQSISSAVRTFLEV